MQKSLSIQEVWEFEKIRYKNKGKWIFLAIAIEFSLLYFSPIFGKKIWKYLPFMYLKESEKPVPYIIALNVTYQIAVFIPFLFFLILTKINYFSHLKVQQNKPWAWENEEKNSTQKWSEMKFKTIRTLLFVHLFLLPVISTTDIYFNGVIARFDLESFPSHFEFFMQISFCMLCEDFMFYWSHRILHTKTLYNWIHKKHHEYQSPFSLSAEYSHPIEIIFGNGLPATIGLHLLKRRAHLFTQIAWIVYGSYSTAENHSGFIIPVSPLRIFPLSNESEYHDYHHSHNVGNYGSFFICWDTIFQTNKDFIRFFINKYREKKVKKNE